MEAFVVLTINAHPTSSPSHSSSLSSCFRADWNNVKILTETEQWRGGRQEVEQENRLEERKRKSSSKRRKIGNMRRIKRRKLSAIWPRTCPFHSSTTYLTPFTLHSSPLTFPIPSPSNNPTALLSSGEDVKPFHKCICTHRDYKDYMKAQRSEKESKILQVFLGNALPSPL